MVKCLSLGLVVGLFLAGAARADVVPSKIAIVNMQHAIQSVDEGKKAREVLAKDWDAKQKKLQDEGKKIQQAMQDLQKQSLVMDPKALKEKEDKIQQQILQLRELEAKSHQEFQKKDQEVSEPIIKKLRGLVTKISKEKGYTLVLDGNESNVIYSETDDITGDVIKLYDKK
jgi:outer membrane protein